MLVSLFRGIVMLLLFALVVGFGACGLYGLSGGLSAFGSGGHSPEQEFFRWVFIGCGLIGFVIAGWFAWLFRKMLGDENREPG
jgi:hypothetical protein